MRSRKRRSSTTRRKRDIEEGPSSSSDVKKYPPAYITYSQFAKPTKSDENVELFHKFIEQEEAENKKNLEKRKKYLEDLGERAFSQGGIDYMVENQRKTGFRDTSGVKIGLDTDSSDGWAIAHSIDFRGGKRDNSKKRVGKRNNGKRRISSNKRSRKRII